MTSKGGKSWSKMYIYTQTDHKNQLADAIFIFWKWLDSQI